MSGVEFTMRIKFLPYITLFNNNNNNNMLCYYLNKVVINKINKLVKVFKTVKLI